MEIKLIVATHKPYEMPKEKMYLPVQAGAALHPKLPYTGDDTGDQISARNDLYCEMTALYWGWKNLDADALGLCHYRRYFQEPGKNQPLTEATLRQMLSGTSLILPKKRNYWIETGESQFVHAHGAKSLEMLRETLTERYPAYVDAFERSMRSPKGHRFNLFIMKREQLDAYCTWLFDILFETEKRFDPPPRMMGFLSERLIDAWVETEKIPYRELPVYQTEKDNWAVKGSAFLLRKIKGGK